MKFFFSKNENGQEVEEEILMVQETLDVPGVHTQQQEIASAIALALRLHTDSIKEEEKILSTVQTLIRTHSAWSCKSHMLRQQPLYMPDQKRTK